MEEASKAKNTHFDFGTYDAYQWYLDLGPVSNIDAKYLHGSLPFWNDVVHHPDNDGYWQAENWVRTLHGTHVAVMNVAGYWDQEDPWGGRFFAMPVKAIPVMTITSWPVPGITAAGRASPKATGSA
jgi:predicted acyl esterase